MADARKVIASAIACQMPRRFAAKAKMLGELAAQFLATEVPGRYIVIDKEDWSLHGLDRWVDDPSDEPVFRLIEPKEEPPVGNQPS